MYRLRGAIALLALQFVPWVPAHATEPAYTYANRSECVVLLHGLGRKARSMKKLEAALQDAGYATVNLDYPSRKKPIGLLAHEAIPEGVDACRTQSAEQIHFVTHSMGAILVRYYLADSGIGELGRVVMLSPPNQGSQIIDKLEEFPGFAGMVGPAGLQLGTNGHSVPLKLGPANFEVGIITGDRSLNLILSSLIPGKDDGKVSIEGAKLEGMSDFLVLHKTHPRIMRSDEVIDQVIHFLTSGTFIKLDSS